MQLEVWIATKPSLTHTENEDRAVVGDEVFADVAGVEHRHLPVPGLLVAVDGLGGHASGHVASHVAAKLFAAADVPTDEAGAAQLLELADRTLHDAMQTDPELQGMGATVALTSVLDGTLITANAGDTSAWRYTDGHLEPLTVSDRIAGSQIGQCLGATHELVPHVQTAELHPGERLLLASDGLTDVVGLETLEQVLGGPIDHAVIDLLDRVEQARFPDDVTIVVAEVQPTA
ncbi:PP2C family serine/threonine-protein phosphatase [Egicoccus sp. AB-alg6-2]|uniref:PP2C family protein-serine/threonine phosphatase n=1 Tax=Egicoccus sp. AB-alg6-2 TaxID=3242692 RepID=UPI00359DB8A4